MENEAPFDREGRDEAILPLLEAQEAESSRTVAATNDDSKTPEIMVTECSPLINGDGRRPSRSALARASPSYIKAINEPWTGAHRAGELPWYKKPSIYWLLPAYAPVCIAFGGIIVPKTYLILDLLCQGYLSDQVTKDPLFTFTPVTFGEDNPQCRIPEVQTLVSIFALYVSLLTGIFAAITTPAIGALSDRIGRKKVLVIASIGSVATEIITIMVGTNPGRISVYWILLGSLMDGLCGSFTAGMALAFAYASDCTPPERRNVAFGYFHGTLFTGIALGPLLAAWLIKMTGSVMVVFYAALAAHSFYILFVLFVIPESLSEERRAIAIRKYRLTRATKQPWGLRRFFSLVKGWNPFQPLWVLRPWGPGTSSALRRNLVVLASIDTMMFGVAMGAMQIIVIYFQYRFGWTAVESSAYLSVVNITRVSGLFILLPLFTYLFRGPAGTQKPGQRGSDMLDIWLIRGAVIFDLLGYTGYAVGPTGAIMVISGMVAALGGVGSPTLQSSLTKHVPVDRTGQILGATGLLHALARVVSPVIFNLIYAYTVKFYAGIVFICLASVFVIVFILSWFLKANVYFDEKVAAPESDDEEEEEEVEVSQEVQQRPQ